MPVKILIGGGGGGSINFIWEIAPINRLVSSSFRLIGLHPLLRILGTTLWRLFDNFGTWCSPRRFEAAGTSFFFFKILLGILGTCFRLGFHGLRHGHFRVMSWRFFGHQKNLSTKRRCSADFGTFEIKSVRGSPKSSLKRNFTFTSRMNANTTKVTAIENEINWISSSWCWHDLIASVHPEGKSLLRRRSVVIPHF